MNYEELRLAVQQYMENDEDTFLDNIDLFIRMAETAIFQQMEFPSVRKQAEGLVTVVNTSTITLPDDALALYSFAVVAAGQFKYLDQKDDGFGRTMYPDPTFTGVPRYYEFRGQKQLDLYPTPAAAYPTDLWYYHNPDSIVETDTSFLGDSCEEALLSATLLRAAVYLKLDEDTLALLEKRVADSMNSLQAIGIGRMKFDFVRTRRQPT
jgi:hypothetical protein